MSALSRIFKKLYALSLKLYPAEHRAKFGAEMLIVFEQSILEASGTKETLFVSINELKDLPISLFRAHWYARTNKEIPMDNTLKQPNWLFYPAWILLSTLAIPLALALTFAALSLIIDQVGGTILVDGQRRITEDYLFLFIFVPLFCLLTSLFQYSLLRRYLPKMGGWIVATGLGWVSVWAAIQMIFAWFDSNFNLLFGFSLIGTLIGFFQWLLLRQRLSQAHWWILANALGWGLAAFSMYTPVKDGSILAQLSLTAFVPALITGFAWWYLLKPTPQPDHLLKES